MSESGAVDPNFFIDQLAQMKMAAATMLQKSLPRFSGQVDKHLQRLIAAIDSASKAYQEAQAHQMAMGGGSPAAGPIDFAGAQTAQPPGVPASV
jgi:hypothetical protein